jgi:hypothetical protein
MALHSSCYTDCGRPFGRGHALERGRWGFGERQGRPPAQFRDLNCPPKQLPDLDHLAEARLAFHQVAFHLPPDAVGKGLVDVANNLFEAEMYLFRRFVALAHWRRQSIARL